MDRLAGIRIKAKRWWILVGAAAAALLLCALLPTYIFDAQEREILRQVQTEEYQVIEVSLRKSMEGKSLLEKFLFLQEEGVEYMAEGQGASGEDESWRIQARAEEELYSVYGSFLYGGVSFAGAERCVAVDMEDPGRSLNVWRVEFTDVWDGASLTAVLDEASGKLIDLRGYEAYGETMGEYAERGIFLYGWAQYLGAYSCEVEERQVWMDGSRVQAADRYEEYGGQSFSAGQDGYDGYGGYDGRGGSVQAESGDSKLWQGVDIAQSGGLGRAEGVDGAAWQIGAEDLEEWGIPPEYALLLEATGIAQSRKLFKEEVLSLLQESMYEGEWEQLRVAVYTAEDTYYVNFHNSPLGFGFMPA